MPDAWESLGLQEDQTSQTYLKDINSEYSLEGLMLKRQYFTHYAKSQLIGKDPDTGKDWRQEDKRVAEDEMVRQHDQLNGHECEQTPRDSEGLGSLVCCSR